MLNFSKIIPDPMFETWFLNNANFFGGPNICFIGNLLNKGLNSF